MAGGERWCQTGSCEIKLKAQANVCAFFIIIILIKLDAYFFIQMYSSFLTESLLENYIFD